MTWTTTGEVCLYRLQYKPSRSRFPLGKGVSRQEDISFVSVLCSPLSWHMYRWLAPMDSQPLRAYRGAGHTRLKD